MEIRFKVAKYALQTVVESLQNENCREFRNEIYVTKEDGELVVVCKKKYKSKQEPPFSVTPGVSISSEKEEKTCEKCGRKTFIDTSKVLTSNPPQWKAICKSCGHVNYHTL
jgi:hypothetical protein